MSSAEDTQSIIDPRRLLATRAFNIICNAVATIALCLPGLQYAHSGQPDTPDDSRRISERGTSEEAGVAEMSRKADVLNSTAWRRAVFELGHWLDTQNLYSPSQTAEIKRRFNERVSKMSSYEVQYLLGDLEQKFQVMDSPEARDARAWVGQYLATVSETKRADMLKNLPDITTMTAAELAEEIQKLNRKRDEVVERQASFESSRRDLVRSQQQATAATQQAVAAVRRNSNAYSPYRGGGANNGKTPYSDVKTGGGVHVGVGPFGAYVSF